MTRTFTIEVETQDELDMLMVTGELDRFVCDLANSYEASVQMWERIEPAKQVQP